MTTNNRPTIPVKFEDEVVGYCTVPYGWERVYRDGARYYYIMNPNLNPDFPKSARTMREYVKHCHINHNGTHPKVYLSSEAKKLMSHNEPKTVGKPYWFPRKSTRLYDICYKEFYGIMDGTNDDEDEEVDRKCSVCNKKKPYMHFDCTLQCLDCLAEKDEPDQNGRAPRKIFKLDHENV